MTQNAINNVKTLNQFKFSGKFYFSNYWTTKVCDTATSLPVWCHSLTYCPFPCWYSWNMVWIGAKLKDHLKISPTISILEMPPTLINLRDIPDILAWMDDPHNLYIGRACRSYGKGSIWQNPFHITSACTREQAVAKFAEYLNNSAELYHNLITLSNKTLGCWCAPLRCHGDLLIKSFKNQIFFDEESFAPIST